MIETHRFDPERLKKVSVRNGDYVDWLDVAINDESCVAAFQEFRADEQLGYWVMWYDEIHFGMSGEAECIYSMPPTYDEEVTIEVREGDLYLIPIGAQVRWRVIGEEPYRTMFVVMPRPRWFEF